jgi:uncharacterized membrane protein YkvA (DUF1232 family)
MPGKVVMWALFAIAYFISPIDVVPDLVPPVTWIDDIGVMYMAWNKISEAYSEAANRPQPDAKSVVSADKASAEPRHTTNSS